MAKVLSLTSVPASQPGEKLCAFPIFKQLCHFTPTSVAMILSLNQQNFLTCPDIFQLCRFHLLYAIYFIAPMTSNLYAEV